MTGVGMTPFVRHASAAGPRQGADALRLALADGSIPWSAVELVVAGALGAGMAAAPALVQELVPDGVPTFTVENASATGSSAFAQAWLAVAAGTCDVAAAVGFGSLERAFGGLDAEPSIASVAFAHLPPVVFALRQARRMHVYGEDASAAASVAVKNFANGARNPLAQRQRTVTLDDVLESPAIADPLRRLECCPLGDGAAAVIVSSTPSAHAAVEIAGSATVTDRWHAAAAFSPDPGTTGRVAALAYAQAGIDASELDVVEVHDAFAVEELDYCEALGLCAPGKAAACVAAGEFDIGGRVAVSPSGGLLARGHPGGATGLAQIVEIVTQLRGAGGARQHPGATTGLAHMIGAGGVGVVHILRRVG